MIPNKPPIIGLTGGIACGKSHLSDALREHGAVVIDADQISRALTATGGAALPLIRAHFGDAVFAGGELDRQKLAALVFTDKQALKTLNHIMHPLVFEEMDKQITQHADQPAVVVDLPLLYETGFEPRCAEVWAAYVSKEEQLKRLKQRGLTQQEALQRLASQMPAHEKALRADYVIDTSGAREDSAREVTRLYDAFIRRYAFE
ncbi:MAG: dephospho-CoA kinase [Clostridiales bacterium]|nr:dephospho-CoA kinase [Clostridiales bacterium]